MAMATTTKASKPTLLIIPVAASPAALYRDVANYLESSGGYEVQVHDLLSASRVPPQEPAGLPEDEEFFHGKFQELPDAGQDVVVLCHSYGVLVATDAAHGLGKDERTRTGLEGGIVRIVYLTCIVGPVGEASADICKDFPKYDFMVSVDDEALYLCQVPATSAAKVYSDLSLEEDLKCVDRTSLQSCRSFTDKVSHDAYRHIPVTYIICTRDEILPPDFQRERIEFRREAKGGDIDTFELDVGHCLNVTAPEKTADMVRRAVEGKKA